MTSVPILWYAVFDFEHDKLPSHNFMNSLGVSGAAVSLRINKMAYFMINPFLYKIGHNGECFGQWLFIKWMLYAMYHALVIYLCIFLGMTGKGGVRAKGEDFGLWATGSFVYGACIIVANILIILKSNIHTVGSVGWPALSIVSWVGTLFV